MFKRLVELAADYYGLGAKQTFMPMGGLTHSIAGDSGLAQQVGNGYGSNVIMTPVRWVSRQFPSAPLIVERPQGDSMSPVESPVLDLIDRPNAYYSGLDLWAATVISRFLDGNAYWIKIRNGSGRPLELWWAPPWMMEPKQRTGSPDLITH